MMALVNNLHNNAKNLRSLFDKLYEAYDNITEVIISVEHEFITCNNTIKISELEIQDNDKNQYIYITDSWSEFSINITSDTSIDYDGIDTFIINDNNIKVLITFM